MTQEEIGGMTGVWRKLAVAAVQQGLEKEEILLLDGSRLRVLKKDALEKDQARKRAGSKDQRGPERGNVCSVRIFRKGRPRPTLTARSPKEL